MCTIDIRGHSYEKFSMTVAYMKISISIVHVHVGYLYSWYGYTSNKVRQTHPLHIPVKLVGPGVDTISPSGGSFLTEG